ncbi:tetratricopeptide repeat protein [Klugiella xanthotipulae]|uniref:Putative thioredoxin n=1 Tax=Klugiella xanthotipulae TaxID=244735 RepID=A0A543HRY1_9MICO|nr:tetratricopeptide repeat protein [Klugiella xanthotipulae]TQM61096.1 putative thioredoxin [Klugiella xanthotipulae]
MSDPRLNSLMGGGAVDLSPLVHKSQAGQQPATVPGAPSPSGDPVSVPSLVMDVTDETFAEVARLSTVVPVIIDLWAEWCQPCTQLTPILEKLTRELNGRILLAKVDVESNPGLSQAFQAQSIPMVVAVVAGKPIPLFQGALPEADVIQVLNQVLELAAQAGVTGSVVVVEAEASDPAAPAPMPPHHAEALGALERGDFPTAKEEYRQALLSNPRDTEAVAGLARVSLLARLSGKTLDGVRGAAAADPQNLDAQLDVADLDLSGGHIEDAFDRLLTLFAARDTDERDRIRERLLELFDVVGVTDPRVGAARRRLTALLY